MLQPDTKFTPVLADRGMVSDALTLIDRLGDDAGGEARSRARDARNQGNILSFCRWRQIERLIGQLGGAAGLTLH